MKRQYFRHGGPWPNCFSLKNIGTINKHKERILSGAKNSLILYWEILIENNFVYGVRQSTDTISTKFNIKL